MMISAGSIYDRARTNEHPHGTAPEHDCAVAHILKRQCADGRTVLTRWEACGVGYDSAVPLVISHRGGMLGRHDDDLDGTNSRGTQGGAACADRRGVAGGDEADGCCCVDDARLVVGRERDDLISQCHLADERVYGRRYADSAAVVPAVDRYDTIDCTDAKPCPIVFDLAVDD